MNFKWTSSRKEPRDRISQAYIWYITSDKRFIVVSKDGEHWQLPGGKPREEENPKKTALRELNEESGVRISKVGDIHFFGFYEVKESSRDNIGLQTRFYFLSNQPSSKLKLSAKSEDREQPSEDQIRFVKAIDVEKAKSLLPWLESSGEFRELKRLRLLDD